MENCAMKKKRIDLDAPFHLFFFYIVHNMATRIRGLINYVFVVAISSSF